MDSTHLSDLLAQAISLAAKAHQNQRDRNGDPYILHPLRVMMALRSYEEMIVAVLHDVIEDCNVQLADLRELGFPEALVSAVDALSRRTDESYDDFIERTSRDPLAVRVKLADLTDNMRPDRLHDIHEKDIERMIRYTKAWRTLKTKRSGGSQ